MPDVEENLTRMSPNVYWPCRTMHLNNEKMLVSETQKTQKTIM